MTTLSAHIHGGPHQSQNLYATRFTRRLWNLDDYLEAPPEARARKLAAFMEGDTSSCCPDLHARLAHEAEVAEIRERLQDEARMERLVRANAESFTWDFDTDTDTPPCDGRPLRFPLFDA